jgi:hypothetical protein
MPRPGCFNPEKEPRYPLYTRLCGPRGWPERVRKNRAHWGSKANSPFRNDS